MYSSFRAKSARAAHYMLLGHFVIGAVNKIPKIAKKFKAKETSFIE